MRKTGVSGEDHSRKDLGPARQNTAGAVDVCGIIHGFSSTFKAHSVAGRELTKPMPSTIVRPKIDLEQFFWSNS
ncbi:hypothetical protein BSN85_03670 [Bradyrhizobium brasilense]|nr:hypothetical protein BSN85_03670 [Bradyrhizobium brasilense]